MDLHAAEVNQHFLRTIADSVTMQREAHIRTRMEPQHHPVFSQFLCWEGAVPGRAKQDAFATLVSLQAMPVWRKVVSLRTMRDQLVPGHSARGRLYDRVMRRYRRSSTESLQPSSDKAAKEAT